MFYLPWSRLTCVACTFVAFITTVTLGGLPLTAQTCSGEGEPNDQPVQATAIAGAGCISAELGEGDQDLYAWTVAEAEARQRWTFTLQGMPAGLTSVQILRVTFAENGVDVAQSDKLYEFSVQKGGSITVGPLLLMPGTYYFGFAAAGGAGAYRLDIKTGESLPLAADPPSTQDTPAPLPAPQGNVVTLAGDLRNSDDYFAWTLPESATTQRWRITTQLPLGEGGYVYLYDNQANQIAYREVSPRGQIDLPALGLAAGDYRIRVASGRDHTTLYQLEIQPDGERSPTQEEEPNDDYQHAWPFDPATPITGAFPADHYDIDFYKITVDETFAANQWQLTATPAPAADYELCLLDEMAKQIQCRVGDGGESFPTLSDLVLSPGEYYITLRNQRYTSATYTLTFEEIGEVAARQESEPNDAIAQATPFRDDLAMLGRFAGAEDDYYRFTVPGPAQLWRVQVSGDNPDFLALTEIDGNELARVTANGATRLRLDDLYLLPGDHFVRVRGVDSDYTVRIIPLGPPVATVTMPPLAADGQISEAENSGTEAKVGVTEREPNNSAERAERLRFDTPRSGRLSNRDDRDLYRFSLAGAEHIRLIVVQPPGGRVQVDLSNYFSNAQREDGSAISYEMVLGPGEHTLVLDASQPSDEIYYLLLQRLDPLALPVDLEPFNEQPTGAALLPATLTVQGAVNRSEDYTDWYRLPLSAIAMATATTTTTLLVTLSPGFAPDLRIADSAVAPQQSDSTLGVYTYTLSVSEPVVIGVSGAGAYTFSVAAATGLVAQPAPATLPLTMTLSAPVAAVAGFWQQGQALDLALTLTNTSDMPLKLTLSAVSTDWAWQLLPEPTAAWREPLTLAGGESRTLPLRVKILPDVGVNLPPRFAVRATNAAGAFVTATLDLPAVCGVPPVNLNESWTTAGALRGGLNMAWRGLGSQPLSDQSDHLFELFDELVTPAYGWSGQPDDRLTVDLAGDDAVPVAGIILNPFGRTTTAEGLRHFELLLSDDGQNFTVVYTGEVAQVPIDQSFALTQPIPARFAQLRLLDNWQGRDPIGLGEFKVIVASDYQPATPFNLLSPTLGGHVVSGSPLLANLQELVSPVDEQPLVYPGEGGAATWVVGFHHNRAAQISALHWRNWPDGAPDQRFTTVEIQVSTTSPVGPWLPLTTWTLDPTSTTTQTLVLNTPVWARFVRYIAQPPPAVERYEYPDTLAIDERPLGDSYRSILAEWGGDHATGIYEEIQAIHALGSQLNEVEPNQGKENAQPLASGQPVNGTTLIGQDEDWFKFVAPADANTLRATLRGDPVVSVDAELLDSRGAPVTHTAEITGGLLQIQADVSPGGYYLRVLDPKRSIVFSWDTSGSVGPYLTPIYQSMATFTQDIDPQYETVNLLPFGDPGQFLLPDFSGDPPTVQQAFNNYPRLQSSSSAETNLLAATEALAAQPGVRAVVLMTDAESSSYPETEKLWRALEAVRPRIFSFEISSGGSSYSQDLMQDWAAVSDGYYANMATLGAFEQGFARATCFLRRPAAYGLTIAFSNEAPPPTPTPRPTATPPPTMTPTATVMPTETATPIPSPTPSATPTPSVPGTLAVVGATDHTGEPAPVIGGGAVELILDASGSMLQLLEGKPRIQIARETLSNLISNVLPPSAQIALRVFGHLEADSCRTDLVLPLQPLDSARVNAIIAGINAKNLAKTPIAASLRLVADDLAATTGQKLVVLVTDGEETCDGDPAAEIANLRAQGIDVRVNIVGFAIDDPVLQATFEEWATLGGGAYFNANNAGELDAAVSEALAAPFRVLDVSGAEVAHGVVNGDPVALPAGSYAVEVLTEPVQQLAVTVVGGDAVTVMVENNRD